MLQFASYLKSFSLFYDMVQNKSEKRTECPPDLTPQECFEEQRAGKSILAYKQPAKKRRTSKRNKLPKDNAATSSKTPVRKAETKGLQSLIMHSNFLKTLKRNPGHEISDEIRKYAHASDIAYKARKNTRMDHTNKYLPEYDYLDYESNTKMSIFKHKEDGTYIVAFKGTNSIDDVVPDLHILFNTMGHSSHFNNAAEDFQAFKETYNVPSKDITLTGHSLGGTTAVYVQQKLQDPDLTVHTFNPGVSPKMVTSSLRKNALDMLLKNNTQDLSNNVTHHVIAHDLVSTLSGIYGYGNAVQYAPLKNSTNPHSIAQFTKE